jgi:hypothetical protein
VATDAIWIAILFILLLCLWALERIRKEVNSIKYMVSTEWSKRGGHIAPDLD